MHMAFVVSTRTLFIALAIMAEVAIAWFFSSKTEEKQVVTRNTVPFEIISAEEHFLQQAGDISQLDKCHHLVIAEIKTTCADLSEEELGKLAVHLLNCQSHAEEREVFPCTKSMTLAECTKSMDATTWNAYQIVSNRARSVCYATRQQQFRMKTEYTVNKLVHTTEEQLQALNEMGKSHEELIGTTTDTLTKVKLGQEELLDQHHRLKKHQQNMHTSVSATLRDLYKEKALVASGNKEFARMADSIRDKLDNATNILVEQESQRRENHRELVDDLSNIREQAQDVLHKIGTSGKKVEKLQTNSDKYYTDTLENLQRLNNTLSYMLSSIQKLGHSLETKINWILSFIGGTENKLELLTTVTLHLGYFLLAALSASFLNTPTFSRIALLVLVPLNAWSQIKQGSSLGFVPMTLFIGLTTLVNWALWWSYYVLALIYRLYSKKAKSLPSTKDSTVPDHSPDTALCPVSPPQNGNRLSQDEYKSLISILEKLRQTGDVVIQGSCSPHAEIPPAPETEEMRVKNASSGMVAMLGNEEKLHETDHSSAPPADNVLLSSDTAKIRSARVDQVRRQLLQTLADKTDFKTPPTPSSTPRSSTPVRTPPRTPRGSRQSTPNRSINKPLCLSLTKAGNPCKNTCSEGSAFCHIHQVPVGKRE